MPRRTILLKDDDVVKDAGFIYICAGYLVEDGKVLLVHHNVFDKWVPPGGHIEAGQTFAETAAREVEEETGVKVELISSQPNINPKDKAAVAEAVPFYVDVEYAFKPTPAIVQFFWVRRKKGVPGTALKAQTKEVYNVGWFDKEQLQSLPTFEQVRTVSTYALTHHPDAK
ncbi:MAG TPA: NUDIX hydrolase [Candidatus Saccharimonadales bacterium]|nr:NUDIX hydrolase [Candidatus Saccharimonadales bacterium]